MKSDRVTYLTNILFPCVVFSGATGVVAGSLIFLFRQGASLMGRWSSMGYQWAGVHPVRVGLLLLAAGVLGLISWFFWKYLPDCRGGGIPASVGWVRGLLSFRWVSCLFGVFASSMITFLGGIPLGTEGPSVQIGTAVGKGTVRLLGRRHPAWDRYVMTGGASAGFAAATGAPLTGILFAFEDAHRRFSPMLLMVSAMTAVSGALTVRGLFALTGQSWKLFDFPQSPALPLRHCWTALLLGVFCGLFAVLFTRLYSLLGSVLKKGNKQIPPVVRIVFLFVCVALLGVWLPGMTGSGHHLMEEAFRGNGAWWILILLLCARSLFLILANNLGVTGGLFLPTLTFGALLGALWGKGLMAAGLLSQEYFGVMVIVGMCSFLGASSRTPLMAIAFSLEALSGIGNVLPVILGVCFAYVVIELTGTECFIDRVLSQKVESEAKGKNMVTVEEKFTVRPQSFAIGKEVRDILWPPRCQVLSIDRNHSAAHGGATLSQGDILLLYYRTYDTNQTQRELESLLGPQSEEENEKST